MPQQSKIVPHQPAFHDDGHFVVGVDIGGTNLRLALATLDGVIVRRWSTGTAETRNPEQVLQQIVDGTDTMLQQASVTRGQLRAIAAGAPGITDVNAGIVVATSYLLGWKDVPLTRMLQQAMCVPAAIDNDVNLATLGEARSGAGEGESDLVFVAVGTGIGAGILLNGELMRGKGWTAGEIGYMLVPGTSERPDVPGLPGPLEQIAGGEGIRSVWRERCAVENAPFSPELTPTEIFDLAAAGEPFAKETAAHCARPLAYAIHNISLVLNVPLFVLGGGVGMHAGFLSAVRAALGERRYRSTPALVASALGADAQLIGALALARATALAA